MRRKTIGRNPLDQLSAPKRKGRKKAVPASAGVQSEIRQAILDEPAARKGGGVARWFESVLKGLTG